MQTIARLNDPSLFTDRCLVGGKWIAAETSSAIEVANPATGQIIGGVPNCRRTETDQAIAAGARAFGRWGRRTAAERAALLELWRNNSLALGEWTHSSRNNRSGSSRRSRPGIFSTP